MIIYMKDIRNCLLCSRGTREFFKRNGLDFSDFLKNGIDSEKLLQTGELQAKRVVERAENK